jgi:hypothetical protein
MTILAVNLVALGVVLLAFSGILFTTPRQLVNVPGMHFETSELRHVIPPVAGALALVGGIALLIVNPKRAA